MKRTNTYTLLVSVIVTALALVTSGCAESETKDTPSAGERVEQTLRDAADAMGDAGRATAEGIRDTTQKIQEGGEKE